jgi:predicted XRE-type DNA-binding protein
MTEEQSTVVIQGSNNVFLDLGFEAEEATNLKVRADLMLDLQKHIQDRGWTQEQAAQFFGESPLHISNLMNGDLDQFSIDQLIRMLVQAGMDVEIKVTPKVA